MHQTFTPHLSKEQIARDLLFLFEIMPDDFICSNGISPSQEIIQRIGHSFRLNINHLKDE